MKILYKVSFIVLGFLSLLLGWNMGVHSRTKSKTDLEPFNLPSKLSDEKHLPSQELPPTFESNLTLTVPPISLKIETASHLEEFRTQARELQNKFPNTFIISGSHDEKKIALTFDDGPDEKTTPEIMNILNEHGIKATFFVTGQNAKKHPNVLQSLHNSGHQIANHSWSHARPLSLDTEELLNEIDSTNRVINSILNIPYDNFRYFRPPYGLLTLEQLDALKANEYIAVCWSIDSMDWYTSSPEEIEKCIIETAHPGAIILLHSAGGKDQRVGTINALPRIITNLSKQGYDFVTIDELLGQGWDKGTGSMLSG